MLKRITSVGIHSCPLMSAEIEPSDNELLKAMRAGSEEALATLYRRRHPNVYRFALQMSGSPELAEDVTQEVFMVFIREDTSYDPTRGPLQWFLLGMARNLVRQRLGRERLYAPLSEESDDRPVADRLRSESDPLSELLRSETIENIRKAVLSLPTRYREVVVLCELQELSYAETAAVLSCAVGTVRSRLHRARALLIAKMRPGKEENSVESEGKTVRCFA